jgi:hypothetical protein
MWRRILKYYYLEIALTVIFLVLAVKYTISSDELVSAIARKIALASAGLLYYYITRLIKVGVIEWRHPYDKIYSIALLLYMAIVFSFG